MKIISFGEVLFDLIEGKTFIGGAPLNFAGMLSTLGAGVTLISRVGDDPLGRESLSALQILGIRKDLVQVDSIHKTGTVKVMLEDGQPGYDIKENVAFDYIAATKSERLQAGHFDLFYFGTLVQRSAVSGQSLLEILRTVRFRYVFCDLNLRQHYYNTDIIERSLLHCNILKINDEELIVLANLLNKSETDTEMFCRELADKYHLEIIIVTAGEAGCHLYHAGVFNSIPGKSVDVVDTVGAGDAFSAGFVYSYLQNANPVKSTEVGNLLGAYVAASRGAIPRLGDDLRSEIRLIIAS